MLKVRQFQNYWFQGMIVLREASLLKKKTKKWTMTQFFPAYQSRICKKEKQISIFCRKFTTSFAKTSVGQRLFGDSPEIHPFWLVGAFLIVTLHRLSGQQHCHAKQGFCDS